MITKLSSLFTLFEKTIFELVSNGLLIHFDDQGGIVTNVDKLYLNREKIDLITKSISENFNKLQKTSKALPAINNSVSKDSIKFFSVDDNIKDIINSSHTFGYTFIYKSKDFNTPKLNNYKEVIESISKEKIELTIQLNELNEAYQKTLKEKKQYRFVAILFFLVLGCLIGLIGLNTNLNQANNTINKQAAELNDYSVEIETLKNEKKDLQNEINYKNGQIQYLNNKNQNLQDQIDAYELAYGD
jgi:chromosome segregation ATPase